MFMALASPTNLYSWYTYYVLGLLIVKQLCVPEYNSVQLEVSTKYEIC